MNWISKAAGALKGDDSSGQAFNLFCECGQQHQGVRRQKWQRIVCRACGGSLFVLQKDPYPPPKEKPQAKVSAPTEVEVEEDAPLEQAAVVEKRAAREAIARPKAFTSKDTAVRPHPEVVVAPSLAKPKQGGLKTFHVVLLLILGFASLTIYGAIRSSQKRKATGDLKESLDLIQDSIDKGAWVEARNHLEIAVRAMEILDRSEADIAPYRQQLRETTVMTSLSSQPISELLIEAEKAQSKGEEDLKQFQYKVQGQFLFVEGRAQRQFSDNASRVEHRIELPIAVGKAGLPAYVVLQSKELARFLDKQESADVIVAAKITAIHPTPQAWEILTETDSTVLWTNPQTYAGLGFSDSETNAAQESLDKQAASLGVSHVAKKE